MQTMYLISPTKCAFRIEELFRERGKKYLLDLNKSCLPEILLYTNIIFFCKEILKRKI